MYLNTNINEKILRIDGNFLFCQFTSFSNDDVTLFADNCKPLALWAFTNYKANFRMRKKTTETKLFFNPPP